MEFKVAFHDHSLFGVFMFPFFGNVLEKNTRLAGGLRLARRETALF
jgi:hypothetical protein